ncbi:LacI family DNA-binding transcriptional regulator [Candidatus Merdisoma sp. HCP28S3_D10]|uniref:LacI family DNA-binding transcriptional regulator n=1 Tax=unclassified Candidatus Merdisoma TaxID=3099611 RepID=UPI003F893508
MVTILDVEKRSGVSKSTISRYLNGKNVTVENRIRIEKAIQELGYRINPIARGLKTNKTHVVGVVIPDITDPFFPPIVKLLEQELRKKGYQTLINNYGNDIELEKEQVEVLSNQRADGLIVVSSAKTGEHIQECITRGIPVVLLDRLVEGVECDVVVVDNYQATFDALSLAIRRGHSRIAIVRVSGTIYSDAPRYQGYVDALKQHNIEVRPEYVVFSELDADDSKRQFMRLMNLEEPPTLIFCSNANMAMGGFAAILEYHLRIPEDVSILTFDRLSALPYFGFIRSMQPEFSSICQPIEAIAKTATDLLVRRMQEGLDAYPAICKELKTSLYMTDSVKYLHAE